MERDIRRLPGVEAGLLNFSAAKLTIQGSANPESIIQEAKKHSVTARLEGKALSRVFLLTGLSCADCAAKLEKNISNLPGVLTAQLNFTAAKLTVEGNINPEIIIQEAFKEGVDAHPEGSAPKAITFWEQNHRVVISAIAGVLFLAGWVTESILQLQSMSVGLYLAAIAIGGYATARKAAFSFLRLNFNMNVLMMIAVTGAVLIGEWSEGAAVAFLFSVSETLESYTIDKARQSIRSLMEITPKIATVIRDGKELAMPVEEIRPGDVLLIKPGEKIAMDGRVVSGHSSVNQAAITGESIPVEKAGGDTVFAGTLNQQGALKVQVTKLASDSAIARIISMVEEAQSRRAPSQAFVDRFARYYTPAVMVLAAGISIIPPLFFAEPWNSWIYRGLTLLVVSCPCALVVSTPVAIVSAIGNAARNGVLIKGGIYLEEAGSLSVVAFDKTGTLTQGIPEVTDIIAAREDSAENEILKIAASVEKMSEHPLASAIVNIAHHRGIELLEVAGFEAITGKGARAHIEGKAVMVGSPRLFKENRFDLSSWENDIRKFQSQGKTTMLVGIDGDIKGIIAVADTLRQNSADAVKMLKAGGIKKTVMLTGDNAFTASAVAKTAGVDEYISDLLPEDKVTAISQLRNKYGKVAMVGDGVNDAPAMATATVGVAMGGAGTDTALETADIVLMADDLSKLPFAIMLSRAALRVIKQNITFAVAVKMAAVLLVFPGWLTLWLAILADMGASVLVTLNGIRLIRVRPEVKH